MNLPKMIKNKNSVLQDMVAKLQFKINKLEIQKNNSGKRDQNNNNSTGNRDTRNDGKNVSVTGASVKTI